MTFSRSVQPHGEPTHPLPANDHASWRRFLARPDLYVIEGDDEPGPHIPEDIRPAIDRTLHLLDTLRSVMIVEYGDSLGGSVAARDNEHGLIHERTELPATTIVKLSALRMGQHAVVEIEIPNRAGPWSICPPGAGATEDVKRARMMRMHRVVTAHLRMLRRQATSRRRFPEDAERRSAACTAHAQPILNAVHPVRSRVAMATPWSPAHAYQCEDAETDRRLTAELDASPFGQGTRISVEIHAFDKEDGTDRNTSIKLRPASCIVDGAATDAVGAMRAMLRLETMQSLTPLYEA